MQRLDQVAVLAEVLGDAGQKLRLVLMNRHGDHEKVWIHRVRLLVPEAHGLRRLHSALRASGRQAEHAFVGHHHRLPRHGEGRLPHALASRSGGFSAAPLVVLVVLVVFIVVVLVLVLVLVVFVTRRYAEGHELGSKLTSIPFHGPRLQGDRHRQVSVPQHRVPIFIVIIRVAENPTNGPQMKPLRHLQFARELAALEVGRQRLRIAIRVAFARPGQLDAELCHSRARVPIVVAQQQRPVRNLEVVTKHAVAEALDDGERDARSVDQRAHLALDLEAALLLRLQVPHISRSATGSRRRRRRSQEIRERNEARGLRGGSLLVLADLGLVFLGLERRFPRELSGQVQEVAVLQTEAGSRRVLRRFREQGRKSAPHGSGTAGELKDTLREHLFAAVGGFPKRSLQLLLELSGRVHLHSAGGAAAQAHPQGEVLAGAELEQQAKPQPHSRAWTQHRGRRTLTGAKLHAESREDRLCLPRQRGTESGRCCPPFPAMVLLAEWPEEVAGVVVWDHAMQTGPVLCGAEGKEGGWG
eukprot:scaffold645_cov247-Pinguiococcus_pyrenoidosus.AAC.28